VSIIMSIEDGGGVKKKPRKTHNDYFEEYLISHGWRKGYLKRALRNAPFDPEETYEWNIRYLVSVWIDSEDMSFESMVSATLNLSVL
jgi:hypothetical protein